MLCCGAASAGKVVAAEAMSEQAVRRVNWGAGIQKDDIRTSQRKKRIAAWMKAD